MDYIDPDSHKEVKNKVASAYEKPFEVNGLKKAEEEIKTLRGILPICTACKKIRDDKGYWNQIENYIQQHSDAEFSHSLCRECAKKLYPDSDLSS